MERRPASAESPVTLDSVSEAHDAADLERATCRALAAGWTVVSVDCQGTTRRVEVLDAIAAALAFPDWFGRNLDALDECLADHLLALGESAESESTGLLLVLGGLAGLAAVDREALFQVFEDAADGADGTGALLRVVCAP